MWPPFSLIEAARRETKVYRIRPFRIFEPENVFVPFQSCLVHGISSGQFESQGRTSIWQGMAISSAMWRGSKRRLDQD
jgi:hypothetical protein